MKNMPNNTLLSESQIDALKQNGHLINAFDDDDFHPIIKLTTTDLKCTWLLHAIDPDFINTVYCLYDLGDGNPQFGSLTLEELNNYQDASGNQLVCHQNWKASATLHQYRSQAEKDGYLTS